MEITKAVIPAAGLGTRFLPATKALPKEMLPIIDTPAIQYIIEEAVSAGLTDILIITGRGKRAIEDHFDKCFELNQMLKDKGKTNILKQLEMIENLADIHYIRQKETLGLGHAVSIAERHINGEPFAVLLGDDIVKSNNPCIKSLVNEAKKLKASIIGVEQIPIEKISSYGVIKPKKFVSERTVLVEDLVEKPKVEEAPSNYAILGRFLLYPEIFDYIKRTTPGKNNEIQLTDALRLMRKDREIYAHKIDGKWLTVGTPIEYLKTTLEFAFENSEIKKELIEFLKEKLY
jgi:UTP--glucose-1-phosphate uridylyltransferase